MLFFEFSEILENLEKISSRIEITQKISELIKKLDDNEVKNAVNLLLGQLGPSFDNLAFSVNESLIISAISQATLKKIEDIKKDYKTQGDLGEVINNLEIKNQNLKKMSVNEVYETLLAVQKENGAGSVDRKIKLLSDLFLQNKNLSNKYIVRIVLGKLRLGFSDKTIIDSLSFYLKDDKSFSKKITKIYEILPDIAYLSEQIKVKKEKFLEEEISPIVGLPVSPMLAQRIKTPNEMIEKMKKVVIEPKLDGLRIIIHIDKKKNILKAYTRNLKEVSKMFPELQLISKYLNATNVILDTEAIGGDFQTTMKRRRKHEISEVSKNIKINFNAFDILVLDNKNMMQKKLYERREILQKVILKNNLIKVVDQYLTDNADTISKLYQKYFNQGFEGIMVKKYDSEYVPGRTGYRWVKMKEAADAKAKLSDTIDCVVMGFSRGKGVRTKFGIGQFLVGVKNNDQILTISKVGTGLTEQMLIELNKKLSDISLNKKPEEYIVHKDLFPDFWVKPQVVVEVAADDITISPKHSAGLALRFPRLIKLREDKSVNNITSLSELKEIR